MEIFTSYQWPRLPVLAQCTTSPKLLCALKQWLCIVCGQPEYIIGELNINSVITEPVSVL